MNHRDTWARRITIGGLALTFGVMLAACGPKSGSAAGAASGAASSARGAIASATANPTTAAQLTAAKALVKTCFAGTPLQQGHQIHLVFLSSASGKNGPAVVAARNKTAACMGISKSDEQPFFNDAVTAAEHGHLVAGGHAARVAYFETLAGLLLKYSNAPGVGNGTANVPGTTPTAPAASTSGASA